MGYQTIREGLSASPFAPLSGPESWLDKSQKTEFVLLLAYTGDQVDSHYEAH